MTTLDERPTTTDWATRAACRGITPDLFFPSRADSFEAGQAAAFCDACPIAAECLGRAYEEPRTHGVRGGRYFDDGHSKEITKRPGPAPEPARKPGRGIPYQTADKDAALARVRQLRHRYPSECKTFDAAAAEYGLHPVTLGKWVRAARHADAREAAQ